MKRRPQVLLKVLNEKLEGRQLGAARAIFLRNLPTTTELKRNFKELRSVFCSHGQESYLLTLLLSAENLAFSQLGTIAHILKLGQENGRYEEVVSRLEDFIGKSPNDSIRWSDSDTFLIWKMLLGDSEPAQYIKLKYRGISKPTNMDSLLNAAGLVAPRIDIPQSLLDFLYQHKMIQDTPKPEWEYSVRKAIAINNITKDFSFCGHTLSSFVNQDLRQKAFTGLDASKGTLLLTYHGGFIWMTRMLFLEEFHDGFTLGNFKVSVDNETFTSRSYRDSLFKAYKVLQTGKPVLMAPDGPHGKRDLTATVCTKAIPLGDGAAFLAYETGCNTAWYTMMLEGDMFVPVVEPGPSREFGESYSSFRSRLADFYGDRITETLSGDPINIAVGRQWAAILNDQQRISNE